MDFPLRIERDVAVIVPTGPLTIGEPAEALGRAVEEAFRANARHLLIDCTNVPYADSSGIGELLAGLRRSRECGGRAGLFGPRGKIHEILDLTQLTRFFVIGSSEQEVRRRLDEP